MGITFQRTRNIDFIEAFANQPGIVEGASNGDYFDYEPDCTYYAVLVDGHIAGIIYTRCVQVRSYDCHAMYLKEFRKRGVEIGKAFWKMLFETTDAFCVTSFASDKFKNGQRYCTLVGLKRVGVIPKYFKGETDVVFFAATKEDIYHG